MSSNSTISSNLDEIDVYKIKSSNDMVFEPSEDSDPGEDYDENYNMQTPPSIPVRSNRNFDFEIFSSIISEQKYLTSVFSSDKSLYQEFVKCAFLWDQFFEMCKYKLFTMADFIHNEYFYKIVDINSRIQGKNEPGLDNGILPILRDLMSRKIHFIIPYVYITNCVPKQYQKMALTTFGAADKYPELIAKAKSEIEASKRTMRPVKDILRTYHIFYESAF